MVPVPPTHKSLAIPKPPNGICTAPVVADVDVDEELNNAEFEYIVENSKVELPTVYILFAVGIILLEGVVGPPGPVAPMAPVAPFDPVDPVDPVAPFNPFVPVPPVAPFNPFVPVPPLAPFEPVAPVAPFPPVGPVMPVNSP